MIFVGMMGMKVKDICTLQNGRAFKPEDWGFEGLPIVRIQNLNDESAPFNYYSGEYSQIHEINNGELLFSWSGTPGTSFGAFRWYRGKGVLNQHIFKVLPKIDVDLDYLKYALNGNIDSIIAKAHGGVGLQHITKKELDEIEIPILPKEKQISVVGILQQVEANIIKRKQQLYALDDLIKARFVEMFGDPVLNQKGFPVYRMDEVVEFQGGSQPDKKYFEYTPTDDNIRLIQIRDYKTDKYITYIPKAMAKRFCSADDIMIGRYGPPIFQILQGIEGSFNVALMKATPKMGNREFVRWFLKQDCLLQYLEGMSQRTAGQDGLQMDKLKSYPFPMPSINLQNEFEQFTKQVDKSKVAVQRALDETQLLFDSLMQKYFG